MRRGIALLAFCCVLSALVGCGTTREQLPGEPGPAAVPATTGGAKIRVVDVSNNTGKLFDVDVIGMLWSALDDSLKQRGLLWTPNAPTPPLSFQASVVEYRKGSVVTRNLLPVWGSTVLAVRGTLRDGERVIASVESRKTISAGGDSFTLGAWRKIYSEVAVDLVNQLAGRL